MTKKHRNSTRIVFYITIIQLLVISSGVTNYLLSTSTKSPVQTVDKTKDIPSLSSRNSITIDDRININLVNPLNNSIVKGETVIQLNFTDQNNSIQTPVTELYRWDGGPNFESILRPLPLADGPHTLDVEAESDSGLWSFVKFRFISDNKPHNITLNSPDNISFTKGTSNPILWSSTYPSGTLESVDLSDITNNGLPDIITGSSDGRIYAVEGETGNSLYITTQSIAPVNTIHVVNNSRVVSGLTNGDLRTFNTTNGQLLWSYTVFNNLSIVMEFDHNNQEKLIYVLHQNGLYSLNYTGSLVWLFNNTSPSNHTILQNQEFLTDANIFGDSRNELITINTSSFITIINATDGENIFNFSIPNSDVEDYLIEDDFIYLSTTNGDVHKYNLTSGTLNWTNNLMPSQNIYQISNSSLGMVCSTGNGYVALVNKINGSTIWTTQTSLSYIQFIDVGDYDKDFREEVSVYDGSQRIINLDLLSALENWNYQSSFLFNGLITGDFNNDTREEITIITTTGRVAQVDPRANVPYLVAAWENISISFIDEISSNTTVWEKYSWDGAPNQSTPGFIPSLSGLHTLEVWVSDNASNFAYAFYQFYSTINMKLNGLKNESYQQSGTFINMTFSEQPTEALYKWDGAPYQSTLTTLPVGEFTHSLEIKVKDIAQNIRFFTLIFITDDTAIASINLISPVNDSIVEGNTTVDIQYSEIPYLTFYSWDGIVNKTTLTPVPISSDTHVVEVFAADEALNWKVTRYVFHTKILISLRSHTNNSIIHPFQPLNFTFGENPDVYQYKINDLPIQSFSDNNKSVNVTLPSTSQTYTITLSVNDSINGRWNNETYIFVVMIFVNVTSHVDEGFAETGDPLVIYFSDPPITRLFSWDGEKNSSRSPIVPGPDGYHFLDIYVGNIEGQFWHYHYDFNVDTDLIDILLISPTNNTKINSWANLTIQFSETPFNSLYQWDNASVTINQTDFPQNDGGHALNVTVFDEASNENSKRFYWIVDDTPINISVIDFLENESSIITDEYVEVGFNNETPLIEWYSWDTTGFSPVLPPNPAGNGSHTLNITVYDGLNWNTEILVFNVTDYPPVFELDNVPYKSGTPLLLNVSEELVEAWHQWDEDPQIEGVIMTVPEKDDGAHQLTIYGKDIGGSFTHLHLSITIDNTAIKILNVSPQNNSKVNGGENVSLTYDETPFSEFYSWGVEWFTYIPRVPTGIGQHVMHIRTSDEAGNLLEVKIIYNLPTPEQEFSEFILPIALVANLVIIPIAIVKREAIKNFVRKLDIVNRLKSPRRRS